MTNFEIIRELVGLLISRQHHGSIPSVHKAIQAKCIQWEIGEMYIQNIVCIHEFRLDKFWGLYLIMRALEIGTMLRLI